MQLISVCNKLAMEVNMRLLLVPMNASGRLAARTAGGPAYRPLQESTMTTCRNDRSAWQDLIQHGNAHFSAGRFDDALAAYDQAVTGLGKLLGACVSDDDVALLISRIVVHQNRATTLVRLGRLREADSAYRSGHAFARAIVEEGGFPENLRQAAHCHCRMTYSEWQLFRRQHGQQLGPDDPLCNRHHDAAAAPLQADVTIH